MRHLDLPVSQILNTVNRRREMINKETQDRIDEVKNRCRKFSSLQLPGQPMGIHMGTAYLVNDLERLVDELSSLVAKNVRRE